MANLGPLRCQRCNKPIGYIRIVAKSSLDSRPDIDNLRLDATCMECGGASGFYRREAINETLMF